MRKSHQRPDLLGGAFGWQATGEVTLVFRGIGSFSGERRSARGTKWVGRLRWAHLVPEALVFSLGYRWGRQNRALVPAAVERSRRSARRHGRRPPLATAMAAVQLGTSTWPFRTTCLVRSMVLARMLRRRGYSAQVVIGIPTGGVGQDPRFAHAWVEVAEAVGPPGFSELVRLVP